MSFNFKHCDLWNKGSACALYLLPVIILILLFWITFRGCNVVSEALPQLFIQYWRWEYTRILEHYKLWHTGNSLKFSKAIELLNLENVNYIYLNFFRLGQDQFRTITYRCLLKANWNSSLFKTFACANWNNPGPTSMIKTEIFNHQQLIM